ncbi:hypothetical protein SUGI_0698580 [Cryptomeria japonica]|nr:hypothetical protein SUGI_0698580 [Cryptomeria japonica]
MLVVVFTQFYESLPPRFFLAVFTKPLLSLFLIPDMEITHAFDGMALPSASASEVLLKGRYGTGKLEEWKVARHSISFYNGPIMNSHEIQWWIV